MTQSIISKSFFALSRMCAAGHLVFYMYICCISLYIVSPGLFSNEQGETQPVNALAKAGVQLQRTNERINETRESEKQRYTFPEVLQMMTKAMLPIFIRQYRMRIFFRADPLVDCSNISSSVCLPARPPPLPFPYSLISHNLTLTHAHSLSHSDSQSFKIKNPASFSAARPSF